jgi:hypothetical protein
MKNLSYAKNKIYNPNIIAGKKENIEDLKPGSKKCSPLNMQIASCQTSDNGG